ncbi:MAG: cell division protein ZapA [Aquisalimonadaceae bacterium]
MKPSVDPVKVTVLDKEYLIACPEEEKAALMKSAAYLNRRMKEIRDSGKVVGSDRIAVMVALNITHEMLQTQENSESVSRLVEDRVSGMNRRLAAALKEDGTGNDA